TCAVASTGGTGGGSSRGSWPHDMQRGFRPKRRKAATRATFQSLTVAAAIPDEALYRPVTGLGLADTWLPPYLVHHQTVGLRSVALAGDYERIALRWRVGPARLAGA